MPDDGTSPWDDGVDMGSTDSDEPLDDETGDSFEGEGGSDDDGSAPDGGPDAQPNELDAGADPGGDGGTLDAGSVDAGHGELDAGTSSHDVNFVGSTMTASRGGTGGSAFSEGCPAGQALVGYQGYVNTLDPYGWINRLQGVCGRVTVQGAAPTRATVGDELLLSEHGADGNVTWSRLCPRDQVLVGFAGRAGSYLDQLTFYCAPLLVSGSAGSFTVAPGSASALPAVGGTGGTAFPRTDCEAGQVAHGHAGRAGQWVDALALVCAVPSVD